MVRFCAFFAVVLALPWSGSYACRVVPSLLLPGSTEGKKEERKKGRKESSICCAPSPDLLGLFPNETQ